MMNKILVPPLIAILIFSFIGPCIALEITADSVNRYVNVNTYAGSDSDQESGFDYSYGSTSYFESYIYTSSSESVENPDLPFTNIISAYTYANQYSDISLTSTEMSGYIDGMTYGYGGLQAVNGAMIDYADPLAGWISQSVLQINFSIDEQAVFSLNSDVPSDKARTRVDLGKLGPYEEILNAIDINEPVYNGSVVLDPGRYQFLVSVILEDSQEANEYFPSFNDTLQYHVDFNLVGFTDDDPNSIPEPSILALMGLGIFGLGLSRRKMKK